MNMVANILGLGNASTPLGLKAMETMQEENTQKDKLIDLIYEHFYEFINRCPRNWNEVIKR